MPILIGEKPGQSVYYQHKIKCPGHYLIPPTIDIYMREPVPELKNCHNVVEFRGKPMRIKKTRIARDRFGNKRIDWKKIFELEKKGIVQWPVVTAAWAIEHVYDPQGVLCIYCHKPCKEGQGRIVTTTINRLMGRPMKR